VEIQWLHVYASMDMDISMDIHRKSVDMDMDMDGKFHIHGNPAKTPILGVQGRSRSQMLVPLESSSPVLVLISSMFVSICNRFHGR